MRARRPAGTLRLPPEFLRDRDDVLGLLRNLETLEKAEHPLERLIAVEDSDDHLVLTTTGVHLARRVHAKPRMHHAAGEELLLVNWVLSGPKEKTSLRRATAASAASLRARLSASEERAVVCAMRGDKRDRTTTPRASR